MAATKKKTKREALNDIVDDYRSAGEPWPADRKTLARWAIKNRRWQRAESSAVEQCGKELAEAMRTEMELDPQGRTVRAKYCAKIKETDEFGSFVQKTLWFDRDAPPNLMHISLQQRRKAILGDNRQLKTDADSYNDNNPYGAFIQLSFNYESDLLEGEQDSEYNPDLGDDEDHDDES